MITSRDNAALKLARKLRTKSGRDKEGCFLVEGRKLVDEALAAGLTVRTVLVRGADPGTAPGADSGADSGAPPHQGVADALYDEIAQTVTPQAVMAVVEKPAAAGGLAVAQGAEAPAGVLVLDRVQDPGNVGTMVRTAYAAGLEAVWCVKGTADLWSDKVVRSAAGALFRMSKGIREGLSAEDVIKAAKAQGLRIVVCDADGGDYSEIDLARPVALVIGSEGAGVQAAFRETADAMAGIPMREGAESLNAAVSAAIVLYERRRQIRSGYEET